jgi:hypothetical protein
MRTCMAPNALAIWLLALVNVAPAGAQAPGATPGITIDKQPETVATRTFDPARPPADMPPPSPGEDAECDSDFLSDAAVGGLAKQTDATHATVTVNQVKVTLQLHITIWVPIKVTQHVVEHEQGHRQISEYYYQTADQLAQRIAAPYMGKQVVITGTDLRGAMSKLLEQMSTDITDEFNKELNVEATQLRFDAITDHSRNNVSAADGMAQAIKDVPRSTDSAAPAAPSAPAAPATSVPRL